MKVSTLYRRARRRVFRGIDIPDDLRPVTDVDPTEVRDSSLSGLNDDAIEDIWDATRALFRSGMHPMVSICLRRRGQMVLNRSLGYVSGVGDDERGAPRIATLDTPVCLFSSAKAVSAMLIHKLAEQGKIDLLAPVSYYLPKFAANGKGAITIHQLLGHRAGVPGIPDNVPSEVLYDTELALEYIYQAEPLHRDGRVMAYHAITGGFVMAELIRVITGKDVQQYHDEVFRKPMGMRYFRYGLPKAQQPKAARNYVTGLPLDPVIGRVLTKVLGVSVDEATEISNSEAFMSAQVPAGNLYATAEEAGRFFQMLLDGGRYGDQQILQPLTIYRATREMGGARLDKSLMLPMRYSAGMMLGGSPVGLYGRNSHYAFGHLGFSNILCWADPERDISVAVLTSGKPVVGNHIVSILRLVNSISKHCPPVVDMHDGQPYFQWEK